MSRQAYVMRDQVRHKIASIMRDPPREPPLMTHPGWVAVTLLVIALNVMLLLPTVP